MPAGDYVIKWDKTETSSIPSYLEMLDTKIKVTEQISSKTKILIDDI